MSRILHFPYFFLLVLFQYFTQNFVFKFIMSSVAFPLFHFQQLPITTSYNRRSMSRPTDREHNLSEIMQVNAMLHRITRDSTDVPWTEYVRTRSHCVANAPKFIHRIPTSTKLYSTRLVEERLRQSSAICNRNHLLN